MLKIFLCIIVGLVIGDLLNFIIYHLCKSFAKGKNKKATSFIGLIKEYMKFILKEFKENRRNFILYCLALYSVTAALTVLAVLMFGVTLKAAVALVFCYSLITLTFVDAKTQFLPDIITKPLIAIGLLQGYFGIFTDFRSSIIGALAGYFILWAINTAFRLLRNKDGMGYGDFKLLSAIGAWVGVWQLPFVILASSIIGIFVALALARLPDKKLSHPSPFGPSLAVAGIVSLFWGASIIDWYLSFYVY